MFPPFRKNTARKSGGWRLETIRYEIAPFILYIHSPPTELLIGELKTRAVYLDRTKVEDVFEDPDDIVFYEIVMTARTAVDAYLITGNKRHYPIKPYVVTPREMLAIIEE